MCELSYFFNWFPYLSVWQPSLLTVAILSYCFTSFSATLTILFFTIPWDNNWGTPGQNFQSVLNSIFFTLPLYQGLAIQLVPFFSLPCISFLFYVIFRNCFVFLNLPMANRVDSIREICCLRANWKIKARVIHLWFMPGFNLLEEINGIEMVLQDAMVIILHCYVFLF